MPSPFATQLDQADDEYDKLVQARIDITADAAELILLPPGIGDLMTEIFSAENEHTVRHNIQILAE